MASETKTPTAWNVVTIGPAGSGINIWSSEVNATGATLDGSYAQVDDTTGALSTMLCVSNFGFTLPTNATVLGVSVLLDVSGQWTSTANPSNSAGVTLLESATTIVGANRAANEQWTSLVTLAYGTAADTWGWAALDRSKVVTTGFGLGVQIQGGTIDFGNSTAYLDRVRVTVHFSYPDFVLPASLGMFDPVMRKEGWFG